MSNLTEAIQAVAALDKLPDGSKCPTLSIAAIDEIANQFVLSHIEVAIAALSVDVVPERYLRNVKSLSPAQQITLLKSHACIVGLGGLGGGVVEILARIGIGRFTLVDGDSFEASNLNRQFLSSPETIGESKAEAARRRVNQISPAAGVAIHAEFLNEDNAARLIAGADIVVDCLDNLKTRFILEKAAKSSGAPLVSAAVAGDMGHVITIFPEDPGLTSIYGPEENAPLKGVETSLGCLPHAVTLLSSLECAEVVKALLNRGEPIRNKMLMVDLNGSEFSFLETG